MTDTLTCISPGDGRVFVERKLATQGEIGLALKRARQAQMQWRRVPVADRAAIVERFVQYFEAQRDAVAKEITRQMGRPIRHSPGEMKGLAERARTMAGYAEAELADLAVEPKPGFTRFIRREPLGVIAAIIPWNAVTLLRCLASG